MKLTQLEMTLVLGIALVTTGCSSSKLSSNYSINKTSETTQAAPEKEAGNVEQKIALFTSALEKLNKNVSLLNLQNAAKTKWTYLGYQMQMLTTDGRGNFLNRLGRANTKLTFSDLQIDSCPAGMVCTLVYQPYTTASLSSECQSASYRMQERILMSNATTVDSNFSWTVVSGDKTENCAGTDEDDFFTEFSREIIRNDPLILVSDNFLYIQSSGLTFIFSKN